MAVMGRGKVFLSRVFIHFTFVDGPEKNLLYENRGNGRYAKFDPNKTI